MSEPKPENVCPVCNGDCRLENRNPAHYLFPTVLDPEYRHLTPGMRWHKEFWVCAACLGTGRIDVCLERTLSGEFTPGKQAGDETLAEFKKRTGRT